MRRITNKIWELKLFKGARTNLREWHKWSTLNCRLIIWYLDSLYTLFSIVFCTGLETMGVKKFDRDPLGGDMDRISTETFLKEA